MVNKHDSLCPVADSDLVALRNHVCDPNGQKFDSIANVITENGNKSNNNKMHVII